MNEHDRVTELIPWYVNGSLDEHEMSLVARHVDRCRTCAGDVLTGIAQSREIQGKAESDPKLAALLAAESDAYEGLLGKLPQQRRPIFTTHRLSAVVAAVALACVGLGYFLGLPGEAASQAGFVGMTGPATRRDGPGPVVQLIFKPGTSEHAARLVLTDAGRLLGSPSKKGVYRLAVPANADTHQHLSRLRALEVVAWAELER